MKGRVIKYNNNEISWISENRTLCSFDLHKQFCKKFNRNDITKENLKSLRLRKRWLTGRTGRFEKGNIPSKNAGPKGPNKTTFRKGNRPHNSKTVGSVRLDRDCFIEVKIEEPRNWKKLHHLIWIAINGEIPEGYCLSFKDGNKTNIKIDNLELITRNENLQINRLKNKIKPSDETLSIVRTMGKITAKTIELKSD